MAVDIGGLIVVIFLYLTTLFFGLWAKWKRDEARRSYVEEVATSGFVSDVNSPHDYEVVLKEPIVERGLGAKNISDEEEETMLAGRNFGWIMGSSTLTACFVGGAHTLGTANRVYDPQWGLLWTIKPWASALGFIFGGLFFARLMRDRGYVTLLDPVQEQYGRIMGVLFYFISLSGEIFQTTAQFVTLADLLSVILDIPTMSSIFITAVIILAYTFFGSLYSVSFTAIIQFFCLVVGLWLCVPFVLTNTHVDSITETWSLWRGSCSLSDFGLWGDKVIRVVLGSMTFQPYYQILLASKTAETAMWVSLVAAGGLIIACIPGVLIGATARSLHEQSTEVFPNVQPKTLQSNIFPLFLEHFTPKFIGWIGVGAICAGLMSTAACFNLGCSTTLTRNIYKQTFRPQASNKEIHVSLKFSMVLVTTITTMLALTIDSRVRRFISMGFDLMFIVLFPNFFGSLFMPYTNAYGSLSSYVIGLFLWSISGGVRYFKLPPLIKYPGYNEETEEQLFPFRIFSMLMCLATLHFASRLSEKIFRRLPPKYDVWNCFNTEPTRH